MVNSKTNFLLVIVFALIFTTWYFSYKRPQVHPKSAESEQPILHVGTNIEFPPYAFVEKDEFVGLDIDLAREVAKRLGRKIEFKAMAFDALLPEIQLGTLHMIAAGVTPTEERGKHVLFTKPHVTGDPLVIVSREQSPIESIEALKGKNVAVNLGYTSDFYLTSLKDKLNLTIQRIPSSFVSEGLLALQSNRADAFIASKSSMHPYVAKHGSKGFSMMPIEDTQEQYALVVSKKHPELFEQIEHEIEKMMKDGTIEALKAKWGV